MALVFSLCPPELSGRSRLQKPASPCNRRRRRRGGRAAAGSRAARAFLLSDVPANCAETPHNAMPETKDFFALFGLRRGIEIDREALEAAYERLTLDYHPDFFATAPEAERLEAERISARVNEGYRVLTDEEDRAAYLLGLLANGRPLDGQRLPDGFLQEMFMVSEEVDELDAKATPERVAELTGEIQQRMAATREARNRLFGGAGDAVDAAGAADDPLLQNIQEHLNCERYFRRLLNTLEDKTT